MLQDTAMTSGKFAKGEELRWNSRKVSGSGCATNTRVLFTEVTDRINWFSFHSAESPRRATCSFVLSR